MKSLKAPLILLLITTSILSSIITLAINKNYYKENAKPEQFYLGQRVKIVNHFLSKACPDGILEDMKNYSFGVEYSLRLYNVKNNKKICPKYVFDIKPENIKSVKTQGAK
jgi:hypothetical protein